MAITRKAFIEDTKGKRVDLDGVPGSQPYQCVDVIKSYLRRCCGISNFSFTLPGLNPKGYARSLWENFDRYPELKDKAVRVPNTAAFVPKLGDIMVWGPGVGTAGHVALCTGEGNRSQFYSLDQNWGGKLYANITKHDYDDVYGVIRMKTAVTTANLNVRSGPGTGYQVVGELSKGTVVIVEEQRGSWSRIGGGQWVSSNYLG